MILPQLGRSENMRLPEDFEEQNTGKPVIYMFVGVCTFIVLLFAVMMIMMTAAIMEIVIVSAVLVWVIVLFFHKNLHTVILKNEIVHCKTQICVA